MISTQINLNMQYGIVLRLTICCLVVGGAFALICCAPDQWEGRMYLDYEKVLHVLLTACLYYNGSVAVSYDYTNSRVFYTVNGTISSPQTPGYLPYLSTYIVDYKKVRKYNIDIIIMFKLHLLS